MELEIQRFEKYTVHVQYLAYYEIYLCTFAELLRKFGNSNKAFLLSHQLNKKGLLLKINFLHQIDLLKYVTMNLPKKETCFLIISQYFYPQKSCKKSIVCKLTYTSDKLKGLNSQKTTNKHTCVYSTYFGQRQTAVSFNSNFKYVF